MGGIYNSLKVGGAKLSICCLFVSVCSPGVCLLQTYFGKIYVSRCRRTFLKCLATTGDYRSVITYPELEKYYHARLPRNKTRGVKNLMTEPSFFTLQCLKESCLKKAQIFNLEKKKECYLLKKSFRFIAKENVNSLKVKKNYVFN